MAFFQEPPRLGNQLDEDPLLLEWLGWALPGEVVTAERAELSHLGDLGGGELYRAQLEDRLNEPTLVAWDPWGHRVDRVEESPLWKRARGLAAEHGLVAAGYAARHGSHDRTVQMLRNYLVQASLDIYACPLAMTDGAARTLLDSGNAELVERAVPRLTSTDPDRFWISGQWMTERTGGSDVGRSETEARPTEDPLEWSLHGTKWFTSAVSADMALTLARPVGNPGGGRGLALFFVELRDAHGRLNGIRVNRLKDKLGTRKVPTAELDLEGCPARLVKGTEAGTRNIASMLNVTRTWNAVSASLIGRRALALARDYAGRRVAFGAPLSEKPLHLDTLADVAAETEAMFHLSFAAVRLMGRVEHGVASAKEKARLRWLTPIAKLTTGKQVVSVCSEVIEAFGGAGYVEDTGLPTLLRDAQVLPIWEGTTNVLSLDAIRAFVDPTTVESWREEVSRCTAEASPELREAALVARAAVERGATWLSHAIEDPGQLEAGARRLALGVGRSLQLALMIEHAVRSGSPRAGAVARRFARGPLCTSLPGPEPLDEAARVALGLADR